MVKNREFLKKSNCYMPKTPSKMHRYDMVNVDTIVFEIPPPPKPPPQIIRVKVAWRKVKRRLGSFLIELTMLLYII